MGVDLEDAAWLTKIAGWGPCVQHWMLPRQLGLRMEQALITHSFRHSGLSAGVAHQSLGGAVCRPAKATL